VPKKRKEKGSKKGGEEPIDKSGGRGKNTFFADREKLVNGSGHWEIKGFWKPGPGRKRTGQKIDNVESQQSGSAGETVNTVRKMKGEHGGETKGTWKRGEGGGDKLHGLRGRIAGGEGKCDETTKTASEKAGESQKKKKKKRWGRCHLGRERGHEPAEQGRKKNTKAKETSLPEKKISRLESAGVWRGTCETPKFKKARGHVKGDGGNRLRA